MPITIIQQQPTTTQLHAFAMHSTQWCQVTLPPATTHGEVVAATFSHTRYLLTELALITHLYHWSDATFKSTVSCGL